MKKTAAWILALVMAVMCGAAAAETFVHGIDPEYKPFSYMDASGEYVGFDVDVAKAACEVAGLDYEVFPVTWEQKLIQMDNHECDVIWSGMTIRESMIEAGYVISNPYYFTTQKVVVRKDSDIATSADLAGKVVAVQLGTSGESLLKEDMKDLSDTFQELVTCENFLIALTELEGGAVDAVFVDYAWAVSNLKGREALKMLDENIGEEYYGMAFRKGEEELCAKIEAAVQTLVENGTYAELAAKYELDPANLLLLNPQ